MTKTSKLTRLAVLVTFALAIHTVEASLPLPLPVPGARLGLANIITLLTFVLFGFRSALLVTVVRTVLGSVFIGTFPGFGFILSFSGGVVSTLAMAAGVALWRRGRLSLVAVSIMGAVFHNTAQVAAASVLIGNVNLLKLYLPLLLVLAIPTGFFTGLAVVFTRKTLAGTGAVQDIKRLV
jgi:heptaprenyl diphosphate synthase